MILAVAIAGVACLVVLGTGLLLRLRQERRAAELSRRQSDLLLRAFFENAGGLVWIASLDGRLLAANPRSERYFARPVAELLGHSLAQILPGSAPMLPAQSEAQAPQSDPSIEIEETYRTAMGLRTFQASKFPLRDAAGRTIGVGAVCADVTGRVQAERALRLAESRLQLFVEHAPVALAMFDRDMCYLAASRRWLDDYNLDRGVIGKSHYLAFPTPVPENWRAAHRRGLAGEVLRAEEDSYIDATRGEVWLRWEVRPWRDHADAIGGIVIFTEDITPLKRAQFSAERSDARYRALIDQSADPIFVHDFQGRFVEASQRACASVGYTREELLRMNVVDLEQDFDLPRVQAAWRLIEPGSVTTLQGHHRRRDGSVFPVEVRFAVLDHEGQRLYLGTVRDITRRSEAERQIREGEERLHLALDAAHAGVWEWDLQGQRNFWSPETFRLYGLEPGSVEPSYEAWLLAIRPEDREQAAREVGLAVELRAEIHAEWRMRDGAGIERWVMARGRPDIDAQGVLLRYRGVVLDITVRKAMELALQDSRQRLEMALSGGDMATWDVDLASGTVHYNERWASMQGYNPGETSIRIEELRERFHPEDRERVRKLMERFHRGETPIITSEHRIRHRDGRWIWVQARGRIVAWDAAGRPTRSAGVTIDVTERKDVENQLRKLSQAVEQSPESVIITNLAGQIEYVNEAFCRSSGYASSEVLGRRPDRLDPANPAPEAVAALWEAMKMGSPWQGEFRNRRKDGSEYTEYAIVSPIREADGRITHYVSVQQDITDRVLAAQRIQHLAYYDQLTGLPNRTLLLDRLRQAAAACARSHAHGALVMIDLDQFKMLNDTLGHDMGDALLRQAAARIGACVRRGDTLARLGGDEFMLVMAGLSGAANEAATDAETVARKILATFQLDFHLGTVAHHCSASIGITLFNNDLVTTDELMKQADLAMYKAKDSGRDALRFFDPQMEAAVKLRSSMEKDLRLALEARQFLLHYQPQVDGDGVVRGVEALVRWRHPQRGLVPPGEFIPVAEETGLILPLGREIFAMAAAQLALWSRRPEFCELVVSVNVSARQIRRPDFVDDVLEVLRQSGARADRLKLELTESVLIENIDDIVEKMNALKAHGVGFSLDDFGTGFSSLSYLKRLPLDQLKIDQSFVRDVLVDPNDAAIARTIIALGASLGLGVIAEGVETEEQRAFLAQAGCVSYQGYLFSRPVEAEALEQLLERRLGEAIPA